MVAGEEKKDGCGDFLTLPRTLNNMNEGRVTGAIFLYLTKHWILLSHNFLLKKLHSRGITGNAMQWFESDDI